MCYNTSTKTTIVSVKSTDKVGMEVATFRLAEFKSGNDFVEIVVEAEDMIDPIHEADGVNRGVDYVVIDVDVDGVMAEIGEAQSNRGADVTRANDAYPHDYLVSLRPKVLYIIECPSS